MTDEPLGRLLMPVFQGRGKFLNEPLGRLLLKTMFNQVVLTKDITLFVNLEENKSTQI